jgi:predicted nucleotidyltransferase
MIDSQSIFGNKICWKIIEFFIDNPSAEQSQTYIIERLGIAKLSAIKWLRYLEKNKLILIRQVGRTNLYRLNKESTIVKQTKVLYTLAKLVPKLPNVEADIYLYGSASRGEDDEKSDIDILVIGKDRSVIDKIKNIDQRIKTSLFSPTAWSQIAREDPAFYERVEKDRIKMNISSPEILK